MTWVQQCAVVTLFLASHAWAEQKLGFVDIQRAIIEVEEGKGAKTRLQELAIAKQKEIEKEQDALRKEKELLDKQAVAMNEETRNQKAADLQKKILELNQKIDKTRTDLANQEQQESRAIFVKLEPIVASIAQREQMDLVLDRQAVVHAVPALDITNEVIRTYNGQNRSEVAPKKQVPSKKTEPTPAGQAKRK